MSDVRSLLIKVFLFDFIVGILGAALIQAIFNAYSILFLLGLAVASLSFVVSSLTVGSMLLGNRASSSGIAIIVNTVKLFIICIIGLLVFNNNVNNVIAYMLGFTSHFIALILYGIFHLLERRK
jgi:ATP synthase protein I